MAIKASEKDLMGNKKEKTVQTRNLFIQGHLLQWEGVIIQISNISLITSSNMNRPIFPIWAGIMAIIGLSLLKLVWYVGLIALAIGGVGIYFWYSEVERVKNNKYLNILLNSGFTYSILFTNEDFLQNVMQVFANIFEDAAEDHANYYIDIKNSTISNGASVVQNSMR